jgi:hypothetical protein
MTDVTISELRKGLLGGAAMSSASDNPPAETADGDESEEARTHLEERSLTEDEFAMKQKSMKMQMAPGVRRFLKRIRIH